MSRRSISAGGNGFDLSVFSEESMERILDAADDWGVKLEMPLW